MPSFYLNEIINNFIKPGLKDLSVTRLNSNWGISVKENNKYFIYVWLDALFNYIFSLIANDDKLYKKFWQDKNTEIIHVIGGDIARFHCVYWPMFLMSCV